MSEAIDQPQRKSRLNQRLKVPLCDLEATKIHSNIPLKDWGRPKRYKERKRSRDQKDPFAGL